MGRPLRGWVAGFSEVLRSVCERRPLALSDDCQRRENACSRVLEPTPCQIPIYHLLHPLFKLGFMWLKGRKIAGFLELFNRSTHQGSGVHWELKFLWDPVFYCWNSRWSSISCPLSMIPEFCLVYSAPQACPVARLLPSPPPATPAFPRQQPRRVPRRRQSGSHAGLPSQPGTPPSSGSRLY